MATVDLGRFRLRPGEVREEVVELELEPFLLGGQRYDALPASVPARLRVSQASGATVFDLAFALAVSGPCMRCLGHAELRLALAARELHDPGAPPGDELRSDYVGEDRLDVGRWARDLVALELPDQVLCRPDCAGLCPVCGKDLNAEPHEHADVQTDPRWGPLEELRERL